MWELFYARHKHCYQDTRNVASVINSALRREVLWENGGLDPYIRNWGVIWKRVANFRHWAASLVGKEAQQRFEQKGA
jgi:hypothetical protein